MNTEKINLVSTPKSQKNKNATNLPDASPTDRSGGVRRVCLPAMQRHHPGIYQDLQLHKVLKINNLFFVKSLRLGVFVAKNTIRGRFNLH
jgi:hypothetical protein